MARLLTGRDERLLRWAAEKIPHIGEAKNFGPSVAVGVWTEDEKPRLMAAVIFHEYYPAYGHCQISAAAADPRWASRKTIAELLAIPFIQFGCNKVWLAIPHTSERVIRFAQAIGFKSEATLGEHFGRRTHAIICRMMARDYDRLYFDRMKPKAEAA